LLLTRADCFTKLDANWDLFRAFGRSVCLGKRGYRSAQSGASGLASGVYFYRLQNGDSAAQGKKDNKNLAVFECESNGKDVSVVNGDVCRSFFGLDSKYFCRQKTICCEISAPRCQTTDAFVILSFRYSSIITNKIQKGELMKSCYVVFIVLLVLVLGFSVVSGQPQYYNANSGGISNTLPFGSTAVTGYKTQHLIGPGEYMQPSPAPPGNITTLYIYMASTGGPTTYTNLTIKMGQTTITTFPAGTYSGQLETVYFRASGILSSTIDTWMVITLDRGFYYDPAQSLVIEISHCGFAGTGMNVFQSAGTTSIIRRNNHTGTTSCVFTYATQDTRILQCGVDVVPAQPQYYNLNTGTSSNSFPFTVAGGKAVNSLFLAGEFNQPTPLPPGQQITTVYLRTSTAGTRTFTNLHILMAQDVITTLTTGTFYAGPYDTVYSNASPTLTSTVDGWMGVRLDHPYPYDPTKSLILFVGQCGATGAGMSVRNSTLTDIRRVWSVCRRSSRVEVHRRHRTTGESFLRATSTAI